MPKVDVQTVKLRFGVVGNSPLLNREIEKALLIAPTDLTVLIVGESGVGKETFPQMIHVNSVRKHGPYIAVNCGAIPEGTIDSELFGHEKGSFTGALSDRKGYFEVADGGTIFLDEVGELPLPTQARLLRVLENGEFIKVGSSKVQKTDVRIVAATNVDLPVAIKEGRFREDLYYRLNTVPIHVPSLRERKEDIPLLFRKFASDFAEKYRMPAISLTEEAKQLLIDYRWPGNIRELKNITERMSIFEKGREVSANEIKPYLNNPDIEKFPAVLNAAEKEGKTFASEREILYQVLFDMRKDINDLKSLVHKIMSGNVGSVSDKMETGGRNPLPAVASSGVKLYPAFTPEDSNTKDKEDAVPYVDDYEEENEPKSLEEVEKEMIKKALERHRGKRRDAAQDLKISERTLYRKIKEYNLDE